MRYASHSAAYMTFGFLRSMPMSTAPVLSSLNSLRCHVLPLSGLAAVDALVESAPRARRAVAAEVGHEHDVGIGRMNADLRDGVGVAEADVRPRLPRIRRLVDAVARQDVAAYARLAHAD